jgi:hypothetical protein
MARGYALTVKTSRTDRTIPVLLDSASLRH